MPDSQSRRARFEALFREHHSAIRAYARRRVPEWRGAARRERLWLKAQSTHIEGYDPGDGESGDGRVLEELAHLKQRDREALTLVAWDGLTPAQAAAVLGEPSARFRKRLQRAGRRLRAQLPVDVRPEEPAARRPDHTPTGDPA